MIGKLDKRSCGLITIILISVFNIYVSGHIKQRDLVYILMWTSSVTDPFAWMDTDQDTFISRKCLYQNCFITNDMAYFDDISEFDAILFNVVNLQTDMEVPQVRSQKQIYIFVGMQSSSSYPAPETFNGFFNRTWTYKLDSDAYFGHVIVTDNNEKIIGPRKDMHWLDVKNMRRVPKYTKHKLRKKTVAAAWFASNCKTNSKREDFVKKLQRELFEYGHRVDIFGSCGDNDCPLDRMDECFALIETDYYFYLAFENSFSEDYVTEQVLFALEHFAVPVVYGGANYTRFMPDGIYLNARKLGETELARKMDELITNKHLYYDFFRWHRYYSFHSTEESPETDDFCQFCSTINDLVQRKETSVYLNLASWWNGKIQIVQPLDHHRRIIRPPSKSEQSIITPKGNGFLKGAKLSNDIFYTEGITVKKKKVYQKEKKRKQVNPTPLPETQTKEQKALKSLMQPTARILIDQAHNWLKQEFEFEYDYQR